MKKIICDGCGEEMTYNDIPTYLKNGEQRIDFVGQEKKLYFDVKVMFVPINLENGEHTDLCIDCRLHLLKKLNPRLQTTEHKS